VTTGNCARAELQANDNLQAIEILFSEVDNAFFQRIINNNLHVLRTFFTGNTSPEVQYNFRPRTRVANRPGMAGIVPELTHGVPCPGRGSFCPGNVKINHRLYMAVH